MMAESSDWAATETDKRLQEAERKKKVFRRGNGTRDASIYDDYMTGDYTQEELSKKYKISKGRVSQVIKAVRQESSGRNLDELRQKEFEKLTEWESQLLKDGVVDPRHADAAVKIAARKAKLMGLDAGEAERLRILRLQATTDAIKAQDVLKMMDFVLDKFGVGLEERAALPKLLKAYLGTMGYDFGDDVGPSETAVGFAMEELEELDDDELEVEAEESE